MRILLAAATAFEIKNLADRLPISVQPVITGVGLVSTAYHLQKAISTYIPDLVIQAGIAGCFVPEQPLGSVVAISEEVIADLGVEENGRFLDLAGLGLADPDQFPYTNGFLTNPHIDGLNVLGLSKARSVSVSEISTRPDRIRWYADRYAPVVESMEGAAFHYVCLQEKVPFIQVRALSNYVGERDKRRWRMGTALSALQTEVVQMIQTLNGQ